MRTLLLLLALVVPMSAAAADHPDFDDLWDYGDPAATETKFREVLAGSAEQPADYVLQLKTQIARTHSLRGQFDEAHAVLDDVEQALPDAPSVARVRYLLERGRTFNSAGDRDKARALFLHAWLMAGELKEDAHAVDAAHMIAIADPDAAMEWNTKALELAESSSNPRAAKWKGSLYNNIGWTHHDAGRYEEALAIFERALAFRKEQGNDARTRIARWCVARAWRSLGRVEEALAEQRRLLAEAEPIGEPHGYTLEEIAECLHALGRADEAKPWFARAYADLSQDPWMMSNEAERMARMAELGGVEVPAAEPTPAAEPPTK